MPTAEKINYVLQSEDKVIQKTLHAIGLSYLSRHMCTNCQNVGDNKNLLLRPYITFPIVRLCS